MCQSGRAQDGGGAQLLRQINPEASRANKVQHQTEEGDAGDWLQDSRGDVDTGAHHSQDVSRQVRVDACRRAPHTPRHRMDRLLGECLPQRGELFDCIQCSHRQLVHCGTILSLRVALSYIV